MANKETINSQKVFLKAIKILISFNGLNLILGFVVSLLLANQFGATGIKDAIDTALFIPQTIIVTLGLNSLSVSSLYQAGKIKTKEELSEYSTSLLNIQFVLSLLIFVLLIIFEEDLIKYYVSNLKTDDLAIFIKIFSFTKWIIFLEPLRLTLGNILTGIQKYGAIPISTIIVKICTIIGIILIFYTDITSFPISLLIGTFLSVLSLFLYYFNLGNKLSYDFKSQKNNLKKSLNLAAPLFLSSFLLNINKWVMVPLLLTLESGSYAAYGYALILNTMLVSLFISPILDSISPILSSFGAENEFTDDALKTIKMSIRTSMIIGAILTFISLGFMKPIVGILFYRGAMSYESAYLISLIASYLGITLFFTSIYLYISRFLLAKNSFKKFLIITFLDPIIKIPFMVLTINWLGVYSPIIASILTSLILVLVGFHYLKKSLTKKIILLDPKILIWFTLVIGLGVLFLIIPFSIQNSFLINSLWLILGGFSIIITLFLGYCLKIEEIRTLSLFFKMKLNLKKKN